MPYVEIRHHWWNFLEIILCLNWQEHQLQLGQWEWYIGGKCFDWCTLTPVGQMHIALKLFLLYHYWHTNSAFQWTPIKRYAGVLYVACISSELFMTGVVHLWIVHDRSGTFMNCSWQERYIYELFMTGRLTYMWEWRTYNVNVRILYIVYIPQLLGTAANWCGVYSYLYFVERELCSSVIGHLAADWQVGLDTTIT